MLKLLSSAEECLSLEEKCNSAEMFYKAQNRKPSLILNKQMGAVAKHAQQRKNMRQAVENLRQAAKNHFRQRNPTPHQNQTPKSISQKHLISLFKHIKLAITNFQNRQIALYQAVWQKAERAVNS